MSRALKTAGIKEHDFHTGEVILNYVAGPDNGPPLVFIPGQTITWEEYYLIMPMLADRFQVYAVTLRGHGKSSWTPGRYTFNRLGADMTAFLKEVVRRPAVVIGNSSGGVLAAWLAANAPEQVKAIVLEDPPLFRCDFQNIKTTFVYDTFLDFSKLAVPNSGGYAGLLANMRPFPIDASGKLLRVPWLLVKLMSLRLAWQQLFAPGTPLDLMLLPPMLRIMMKGVTHFDGHFSRAFVDGTMGEGFDHAETLARITQPVLFLHAKWFKYKGLLFGALDDDDVARVRSLVKGPWKYLRMDCQHPIALDVPKREAEEIATWMSECL